MLRAVILGVEIQEFRVRRKGLKAVCEPLRDLYHFPALGRQLNGGPLAVGRRSGPQIDEHIIDGTSHAFDKLCICFWRPLEVHAAKRPGQIVVRYIALGPDVLETMPTEFVLAK